MLRDAAVDIIMFRSGNRKDPGLRDAIIAEMAYVQENILEHANFQPYFLLTETVPLSTTVGDERISVPSDFIMEWEEGALYLVEDDGSLTLLYKDDMEKIRANTSGVGKPIAYDLAGEYFLLGPTPDKVYNLQMKYYGKAESLAGTYGDAANIENVWLKNASDWFIAEVGAIIAAQHLYNEKLAVMYIRQGAEAKKKLMNGDIARREVNKDREMYS